MGKEKDFDLSQSNFGKQSGDLGEENCALFTWYGEREVLLTSNEDIVEPP